MQDGAGSSAGPDAAAGLAAAGAGAGQAALDAAAVRALDTGEPFDGWLVAIGASAGGLDALERLFDALPSDTGACFIVIQHLSPDHKSMMDNLLARHTRMPVLVATHRTPLAPNHVFLIPPAMHMTVADGRLHLVRKPPTGLSLPIDVFFRSAAAAQGDRTIAVVLSGTGSDGARGVQTVNEGGGLVMVQDPQSAKFDGMPRSAIATGLADDVLAPLELAARLVEHLKMDRAVLVPRSRRPPADESGDAFEAILQALITACGINFRDYKINTVLRRIERRMQVRHTHSFADYLACLQADAAEVSALRRELLIPVTRFFRDPEAFDALAQEVIPQIIAGHTGNEPIRVWVACCSTGEEAYSVAMLFAEAFDRMQRWPGIKIFVTDVEPEYLDAASAGVYPETIAVEVSPERLERFFTRRDHALVVRSELRQNMIFARHNLVEDPPFTRMDLVTCRNMLIYLQPRAQQVALSRLQYALAGEGTMFLGSSETLGPVHDDFAVVSGKHKIYRVLRRGRLISGDGTVAARAAGGGLRARTGPRAPSEQAVVQTALSVLLRDHTPPAVLIGPNRQLVHVFGAGRRYLNIGEGDASLDVLKLLPREVSATAAAMLHMAEREGGDRRSQPVALPVGKGEAETVHLLVRPLAGDGTDGMMLLVFEPARPVLPPSPIITDDTGLQHQIEALETELASTRANLQATIEELETANEELQATNEEMIASNEELQSTNEELQSVNEELFTVNSEYQEKVDVLNRINADLENMSRASSIATLFVDEELRLTRFTAEAAQLFKVLPSDLGRSIEDFANLLDYPEFYADLRRTVADGNSVTREVRDRSGRWFLARIQPYAQSAKSPRRAVTTFIDVTVLKDAQRLQAIIDSLPEHIAVLDARGVITVVNRAWRDFAESNGDIGLRHTGPGSSYLRVCAAAEHEDEDAARARAGLAAVLAGTAEHFTMQYPCHSETARRWFLMHAARIRSPLGGAVVSHVNITAFIEGRAA